MIRHWLRLSLLTANEKRMLKGLWWDACTKDFTDMMRKDLVRRRIPLKDKQDVTYILDEFSEAITWLEGLRA